MAPWQHNNSPGDDGAVFYDYGELNINPPTPCLGKRPQIPKPQGPGRPYDGAVFFAMAFSLLGLFMAGIPLISCRFARV